MWNVLTTFITLNLHQRLWLFRCSSKLCGSKSQNWTQWKRSSSNDDIIVVSLTCLDYLGMYIMDGPWIERIENPTFICVAWHPIWPQPIVETPHTARHSRKKIRRSDDWKRNWEHEFAIASVMEKGHHETKDQVENRHTGNQRHHYKKRREKAWRQDICFNGKMPEIWGSHFTI